MQFYTCYQFQKHFSFFQLPAPIIPSKSKIEYPAFQTISDRCFYLHIYIKSAGIIAGTSKFSKFLIHRFRPFSIIIN